MRHLVVGTAGHIDHGKSALVEAITGTHPDRLAEEKRRGITIDLGFADTELSDGTVLSFVDVPGHERFVRHMVAGATGLDAVLLVIAADEGVMPQTREHHAICALLGIGHGVVALSKSDIVDPDIREVVAIEIREFLSGSFLEDAPIVPVSAKTGEGLDRLRAALADLARAVPERPLGGVPRLPVDRSFVMRGFGTVVTGTLVSGRFAEGDEVEILPGGRRARIRSVQVHHRRVPEAVAGQRTALNLQGIETAAVPRGVTVTVPGALVTTRRLWARVSLLPGAKGLLAKGGDARLHHGTSERAARLRPRSPGGTDDQMAIVLGAETVLLPGDRFVLRRPAPVDTIGGGVVLDIRPPKRLRRDRELPRDEAGLPGRLIRAGFTGVPVEGLAAELGIAASELERRIAEGVTQRQLVLAAGRLFGPQAWARGRADLLERLAAFHREEPLRVGISREVLRAAVARELPQEAWRVLLDGLEREGVLRLKGEILALSEHRVVMSEAERSMYEGIDALFRRANLDPPDVESVLEAHGRSRAVRIIELLVADGRLERIRDGRYFHHEALEALRGKLLDHASRSRTIDVAAFKELAGVTRKNAIPLLEQLDAERRTRRVGNVREILTDGPVV